MESTRKHQLRGYIVEAAHKNLGARIRRLREEREWTQEHFAKTCGLSGSRLSRIELGEAELDIKTIAVIARKFGSSLGEILKGIA